MMMMPNSGLQIRLADGGYIIQWMELRKSNPDEAGGNSFLEQERRSRLSDCLPNQRFAPPRFKCAVRVKLEDALKLVGEVLQRLQEIGVDDDGLGGPGSYIA